MKDKLFQIRAFDPSINMVITFWLGASSRQDLDKILKNKNIKQIEWIREEHRKPPFL
jgi:hypothetical protein